MAKILIVEDELMSRSMLELILQQAGHEWSVRLTVLMRLPPHGNSVLI
jgi:DNA-binding response OmpR family regulator